MISEFAGERLARVSEKAVPLFWALPVAFRRAYVLLLSVAFYASWTWMYAPLPFVICAGV